MKTQSMSLFGMLCLVLFLTGCPSSDTEGPSKTNNKTNPDACAKICEPGDTRCTDGSVEACSINAKGCYTWESGKNCPAAGLSCDDSVQPTTCITESGTCDDSTKNQDETDTDCGGLRCAACLDGKSCATNSDCSSGNCDTATFKCAPPVMAGTCVDGVKNQDETDVDCGGATCPKCAETKACKRNEDCATDACDMGSMSCVMPMANPTCSDNIKNQDETDADCGGATCGKCEKDKQCAANSDCVTDYCDMITTKCTDPPVMETCSDNIKNQDETDVDCGGATCNKCLEDKACAAGTDCQSNNCDIGKTDKCVAMNTPTCADGVKNQDETDVDCGGACPACNLGQTCDKNSDCANGVCDFVSTGTCIDAKPTYEVNEDFESNSFDTFPYEFASNLDPANHWVIEQDASKCHMGSYCMRTNPNQQLDETTTVEVSLSVRQDTQITFWAKTNTEPNQHYFRFYIDGVQVLELSGQNDWKQYSFPVTATGPNGPNRVFKWEFLRANFVDPNHVPWMEVWIDDIDFPDWNTEPTTPELIAPWDGTVTTNTQPTLRWRSFDSDFDPITYEVQWDTDPNFSNPDTTGETNDLQHQIATPLQDNTVYYWRARAKDDSNYRWSEWTRPWSIAVDTSQQVTEVWRQNKAPQFQQNDLQKAAINGDSVEDATSLNASQRFTLPFNGASKIVALDNLPMIPAGTPGTVTVTVHGDINSSSEVVTVQLEGQSSSSFNNSSCRQARTYNIADIGTLLADGQLSANVRSTSGVDNGGCSGTTNSVTIAINVASFGDGTMVSTPIAFSTFNQKKYWEKVHMVGQGDLTLQVLDEQGTLIPDTAIPNNSTGNTTRTLHLWTLDPVIYPVIRLKVTLGNNASLDEWSVHGNDRFEWRFDHDGDQEGWQGVDRNATPTVVVQNGTLRFDTTVDGTEPRIEYFLPQPVDATRFTTVAVRLRTSNNYMNDDVRFTWQSNFGLFDTRRSFVQPNIFLQSYQDVTFDLTQMPMAPNESWRGQIEAIRIDPVVDFFDQLNQPSDGWFEIEYIAIY